MTDEPAREVEMDPEDQQMEVVSEPLPNLSFLQQKLLFTE